MEFVFIVLGILCTHIVAQDALTESPPWHIRSSHSYSHSLGQTIFTYTVNAGNGKVTNFLAGIPSCPEITVIGNSRFTTERNSQLRGIRFSSDIQPRGQHTFTVAVNGIVNTQDVNYAITGDIRTAHGGFHHKWSRGTVIGPQCTKTPIISCDLSQERYTGECVGNAVRVPLMTHSKYHTKLRWSTDYPGCSFTQVDTVHPTIAFHGPICDTEFRVRLEVWGPAKQYEECWATIYATDTVPPTFSNQYGGEDTTVNCDDIPAPVQLYAKDTCDNDVQVDFEEREETVVYGDYHIYRRWTARDHCDNKETFRQRILVQDAEEPRLIGVPDDETVDCDIDVKPCVVTALDNCDDVTVEFTEKVVEGSCLDSWKVIRTWSAQDSTHNAVTAEQTVTVQDDSSPSLWGIPDDTTVDCDQVPGNVVPSTTDNCEEDLTVAITEKTISGTCKDSYRIIRTFTVVDLCGNKNEQVWNVWVHDLTPPTMSEVFTGYDTVPCDNVPAPCVVEAQDNCAVYDLTVEPTISYSNQDCEGNYTVNYLYSVSDNCGNEVTVEKAIVVVDTEPPRFTQQIPAIMRYNCHPGAALRLSAVDNCGQATVTTHPPVKRNEICDYTYDMYHSWTATDECGHTTFLDQIIRVTDDIPPVLIGGPPDLSLPCDSEIPDFQVTAYDNCDLCDDSNVDPSPIGSGGTFPCDNYIIKKYYVDDCCGLTATHEHTIHFYDDVPPVLVGVPSSQYLSIESLDNVDPNPDVTAVDNCDQNLIVQRDDDELPGTCPHNFKTVRSWWTEDDCGNVASAAQTIYCDDTTKPEFVTSEYQSTSDCYAPVFPEILVTDNGGDYTVDLNEKRKTVKGTCEDQYSVVRRFTATDICGNKARKTYTTDIYDLTPPTWTTMPHQEEELIVRNTRAQYEVSYVDEVEAYDACAGPVDVIHEENIHETSCSNEYLIVRTWDATDNCGNAIHLVRSIDVQDQESPTLINVPVDTTVDCTDDWRDIYNPPLAYDYGYDGDLEVTSSLTILDGEACEANITAVKCWRVHDCVGQSVRECQTITVRDNRPPTWTYLPADKVVPCDDIPDAVVLTAEDECGHASVQMWEGRTSGTCEHEYTITRTYVATDDCDLSVTHVQTLNVVDNQSPYFTKVPDMEVMECGDFSRYVAAVCADDCDYRPTLTRDSRDEDGTCDGDTILVREWTCEDDCGNVATAEQKIYFKDTTPPRFNYYPNDLYLPCDTVEVIPNVPGNIRGIDDCDDNPDLDFLEWLKPGAYGLQSSENIREWTVTDHCGNTAVMQQTITVYDDVAPVVVVPSSPDPIECHTDEINLDFVSVSDNCDPDPSVDLDITMAYINDCDLSFTKIYTWCPIDKSGNEGTCRTATVIVADGNPPTWSHIPQKRTVSYTSDDTGHDTALTCDDTCGGAQLTMETINIDGSCANEETIVYKYHCTDLCGNAIDASQTIYVVDDVLPPLAPLPAHETIECGYGAIPEPDELSSNDPYSGYIDVSYHQRQLPTSCEAEVKIVRKWQAIDCAGNIASHIQTLSVEDTEDPTLPEMDDETHQCEHNIDIYVPLEAYDKCDSSVDVVFTEETCDEGECWKEICRHWVATDDCGNWASEVQTIRIHDTELPQVYGNPEDVTVDNHNIPGTYDFPCNDNCFNDIIMAEYEEIPIEASCPEEGTIVRHWKCTDDCGQIGTITQTITVVDNEKPVISYCPQDITVQEGLVPPMPVITATDAQVYGEVDVIPDEQNEKNMAYDRKIQKWVYRTWTAKDGCDNIAQCKQTITVIDTIPPVIPDVPRDKYMDCDDILFESYDGWAAAYLSISRILENAIADDQIKIWPTCWTEPDVNGVDEEFCDDFPKEEIAGTCKGEYTIKRTWTATDHAGNSLSDTQVITVVDDKPPTFDHAVPASVQYDCHAQNDYQGVQASDNCDWYVLANFNEKKTKGKCIFDFTVVRVWTATDQCGNSNSMHQTVWVSDTTPPTMDDVPEPATYECTEYNSLPAPPEINCYDNCDTAYGEAPVPQYSSEKHQGSCHDDWVFIRTWTCTDSCGHSVTKRSTLSVYDTQKPEFDGDYTGDIPVDCDADTPVPTVTATDECSEYVQVHYEQIGSSDDYTTNSYVQKWSATDACGNSNSKERTVTIEDPEDPVISPKPPSAVIDCDAYNAYEMPEPHCDDNCGAATISRTVETIPGTCESEYTLKVTWTCEDSHGRQDSHEMIIEVVDNEDPSFSIYTLEVTAPCDDVPPAPSGQAGDSCGDVTVGFNEDKDYFEYVVGSRAYPPSFSHPNMPYDQFFGTAYWKPDTYYGISPMRVSKLGTIQASSQLNIQTRTVPSSQNMEEGWTTCAYACNNMGNCKCFMQWAINDVTRCYFYAKEQCLGIRKEAYKIPDVQGKYTEGDITDPHTYGFEVGTTQWMDVTANENGFTDSNAWPVVSSEDVHLCDRYILTRTWTAEDECGNQVEKVHKITVNDVTPPVWTVIPHDVTMDCTSPDVEYHLEHDEDDEHGGHHDEDEDEEEHDHLESREHGIRAPKAWDQCSPTVKVDETLVVVESECEWNWEYKFEWTATDDCGLTAHHKMSMWKIDNTAPTLSYLPGSMGYECTEDDEEPELPEVTCVDDCVECTVTKTSFVKNTGCNASWVYTWTATDDCGNSESSQMQIFIYDSTPPVLEEVPDTTIDCDDPYVPATPTASDLCNEVTVTRSVSNLYTDCPAIKKSIYTWIATDECGNKVVDTTTVTTLDENDPVITGVPDDYTDECETTYTATNVACTDDCGDAQLSISYDSVNSDCEVTGIFFVQYRHWTCVDACGNTAEESLTITVTDDEPPTINKPDDQQINCEDAIQDPTATADDDCGEVVLTSSKQTIEGTCEDEFKIVKTWVAVDRCGRVTTVDHTLTVVDDQDPTLEGVPDEDAVDCADVPAAAAVTVKDNCAQPVLHYDETSDRETYNCHNYNLLRRWYAVDNCGNSVEAEQVITVTDTTDPVLTCDGNVDCEDMQIECEFYPPLPIIVAVDDCFEHVSPEYEAVSTPGTCDHDHIETRTWTTSDECGGTATIDQVITYVDDTEPVFEGECEDVTIDCTEAVVVPVLSCNDNCDYALDINYDVDHREGSCHQFYQETRTWTCEDVCGHSSSMSQEITIIDEEVPTFSYLPAHAKVECHLLEHIWPGDITASDNCDYNLDVKFTESRINGTCDDEYTLIRVWTAIDCSGNVGSHEQTVQVVDSIPPSFVGSLPVDITVSLDDIYSGSTDFIDPLSVTGEDNCGFPDVEFTSSDIPMDYECDYITYRIWTWTVTDDCGNSETRVQTIEMVRTAAPQFIPIDDVTVDCDAIPPPCDAELVDPDAYAVTLTFSEHEIDGTCEDNYQIVRTWTASDCAYNAATMSQTVHVQDREAPVFSRSPEDTTVECDCEDFAAVPDIDAIDNCDADGDNLQFDETEDPGTCDQAFEITRTWTATDACGNVAILEQVVTVEDNSPPLFCDDFCDEDFDNEYDTVSCSEVTTQLDPLVKDNCDDDVSLQSDPVVDLPGEECENDHLYTYSWTAYDDCGNSNTCTTVISVVDDTPPECTNCEQLCYPLTGYGPTETEYAVYTRPDLLIEAEDDCGTVESVELIFCNSTHHHPSELFPWGHDDCRYYSTSKKLYVHMALLDTTDHLGRTYFLWFRITDNCGWDRVVSRSIWIPPTSFAYHRAVDQDQCLNGLGTDKFAQGLPTSV